MLNVTNERNVVVAVVVVVAFARIVSVVAGIIVVVAMMAVVDVVAYKKFWNYSKRLINLNVTSICFRLCLCIYI